MHKAVSIDEIQRQEFIITKASASRLTLYQHLINKKKYKFILIASWTCIFLVTSILRICKRRKASNTFHIRLVLERKQTNGSETGCVGLLWSSTPPDFSIALLGPPSGFSHRAPGLRSKAAINLSENCQVNMKSRQSQPLKAEVRKTEEISRLKHPAHERTAEQRKPSMLALPHVEARGTEPEAPRCGVFDCGGFSDGLPPPCSFLFLFDLGGQYSRMLSYQLSKSRVASFRCARFMTP